MHHKEKDVLRQIQEFFCFREFVVSSGPRSAPQTACHCQEAIFLEGSLDKVTFSLGLQLEVAKEESSRWVLAFALRHYV